VPIRFLLDEHLRGKLWNAIRRHNAAGVDPIDAVRVGDPPAPALGAADPDILAWAEHEGRVVITLDKATLPGFLAQHLQSGRHSPGIQVIRPASTVPQVVTFLAVAAHASDPLDWQDRVEYIP
jgi:predicted nuclease of predicted toxin-antitoxin system